ncbi:MAG: type II CRISPR-associated endonuclease Cas1 [Alphaproteobacteria bacterium]|nr:type II CRISPR-associated endonuclease Cas1 [Alphaproteobacteria bacterium]
MDKQIIEISKDGFYLSLYRGFLTVQNDDLNIKQNIPLDNILSLVISANNATISKNIINALCEQGASVIFCNQAYLPTSITLPYTGHWLISSRVKQQLEASVPLQKNLWKSIVQHKILNQAKILEYFFPEHQNIERLKWLSKETLSNDAKNHEAQAASIYFKSLFGKHFVRDRLNDDANILLNYSYTILRAMVARAVAGNGLLPYIGIKHCNKTNPLPLVDDLIEPFRPIADKFVFEELNRLVDINNIILTPETKRRLAGIITYPVETIKGTLPLNDAIYDFITSLVVCHELKRVSLTYPKII